MIHELGSGLVVVAAAEAVACAVFYGGFFRWWSSAEGRHLFAFMAVIGACLGLWTVFLLTSGAPWMAVTAGPREWARVVTFALISWVIGWRLVLLVKAKHRERRQRKEGPDE